MVVSLTNCAKSHELNMNLKSEGHLLHVAITDLACDRLEETGILIPMIPPGSGLIQLVSDFK